MTPKLHHFDNFGAFVLKVVGGQFAITGYTGCKSLVYPYC